MHYAPDIGLRAAHRDTGDQRHTRDLQVIAQHAIVRLHHVVIAVLRKLDPEPVGWLAGPPGPERIDHDDVVAVSIDRPARPNHGIAARERSTLDPLLVHISGIA